ncbi:MAG: DUF445 domain-containing protein [Planctomycetota bacterium]
MSPWIFVTLPLIGGLIGWATNWVAVRMIFRPRRPVRLLGFAFQGLLPRRRSDLARSVADTVERDLISVDDVQQVVHGMVKGERVRALLHERVDRLVAQQIEKLGPMVKMFVPGDLVSSLKAKVEEEVILFIESMSGELRQGIAEQLDVHEMVRSRIEGYDLDRLEQIVNRIASQELRHIEVLGGVLGVLIGLVEAIVLRFMEATH